MASDKSLFLGLLALRFVNALMIQTHFVPDEYWQSLEVGHNMAFGYGYLTWEWREGIRGYGYPLMFAVLYKFLQVFGLDSRILLIKFPRLLQGVLAAIGDLHLYKLSRKLSDTPTAQWTLLCQVINWFTLYCCTRTLTNSTEAVLVTVALYYFPWPGYPSGRNSTVKFLIMAALSVVVRPTAAIMWILLCSWHLQRQQQSSTLFKTLKSYIIVGSVTLSISSVIDRVYYNNLILVQWNFVKFNVLSGNSAIYGSHPWHWYISQGLPVIMATHTFPFLLGAWYSSNKALLCLIVWNIFIYSFLPHKEFRFLLPILPLSMHYCGIYFQSLKILQKTKLKSNLSKAKIFVIILMITNIPLALYFSLIHQRGTILVTKYLYDESLEKEVDILFLMPCHSTPYYSYLHRKVNMRFLTCEPNLSKIENYTEEQDVFYSHPVQWLREEFAVKRLPWPSHIVYFNTLQPSINSYLLQSGYKLCDSFFHTHFPEGRVGSHVMV
ncbi:hypothetical protein LOTGIDRAFT_181193, partial [Lottia gigantea]